MKKSIFRWGFVLCMLLCLMTIGASAKVYEVVEGPTCPEAGHAATDESWVALSSIDDVVKSCSAVDDYYNLNEGNYYLTDSFTLDKPLRAQSNMTICLNGNTITTNQTTSTYAFMRAGAGTVTLCDCKGTGKISGGTATGTYAIGVASGNVILRSGTIEGFKTKYGIHVQADGEFIMNGGTIKNFVLTTTGGAVYNYADTSKITMNGGTISDNTKGGVTVGKGTFTMDGGTITRNGSNTLASGGGVNNTATGGEFIMNGGTISENKAKLGPAVISYRASMTMAGGSIINNTGYGTDYQNAAVVVGADVDTVRSGSITVTGGEFYGNTANGTPYYDVALLQGSYAQTGDAVLDYGMLIYPKGAATTNHSATVAAGKIARLDKGVVEGVTNVTYTVAGGTYGYDVNNETFKSYLDSEQPLYISAATVEGWENAVKVTKGYKRMGAAYDFCSSLNFGVKLSCDSAFIPESVVATVDGIETTADITDGVITVMAEGITAKDMGKEIDFSVESDSGISYYHKKVSVADVVAADYEVATDEMKTLMADMINYGKAAAAEWSGAEITVNLGEGSKAPEWEHNDGYGASADDMAVATLSLKDKVVLNIYINGEATNVTVDGVAANATVEDGISCVTIDKAMSAAKTPITLAFTVGGTEYTVVYSIADYVIDALEGEQAALIGALQKYIESVCAVCAEA